MRIALLSYEYPPETGYGGIGTYTWYQARALAKLGHEVHVIAGATQPTRLAASEHDGVQVFRFRGDGFIMRGVRSLGLLRLWWTKNRLENALSMYHGLRSLMRRHEYDLVEMPECGAEGLLVANLLRVPALVKFHSPSRLIMHLYDVRRSDIAFCSYLEQLGIRGADALTSCSRFLADEAREKVAHPAADPRHSQWDRSGTVRRRGTGRLSSPAWYSRPSSGDLLFGSDGATERNPSLQGHCHVDTGTLRRGLRLCRSGPVQLHDRHAASLLGNQESEGVDSLSGKAGSARGAVVAAADRHFSAPQRVGKLSLFMPGGDGPRCAIVASDQGGVPELIEHGVNGLLARTEDPSSFIRCLERYLEDRSLRERLSGAARRTVEESFTDVHIASRSIDYYRQCLNGEPRGTVDLVR